HPDVVGNGQPAERALLVERRKPLRRASRERAPERGAGAAQGGGEQLLPALLEPWPGEADQDAASLEPGAELFLSAGNQLADIGEHDGRDLLLADQLMHRGRDIALGRRDDL